tara:strand:+ start:2315 stop:2704 length:390 start_codon:yes stop_codon:yes gene_type:complete
MKQYNIFGELEKSSDIHPQIEDKKINSNYYGSDLNKFVAVNCREDMVVNNIDLIINNYKEGNIKIIESKHSGEKLQIGQKLLLKKLSKIGIKTYVIYGDEPYFESKIYSFQNNQTIKVNKKQLIKFLNK